MRLRKASAQDAVLTKLPSGKPRFVEPMKAKLVEKPPATGDWIYELKFDGIRLIAIKDHEKVSLLSRNQNDLSARFPEIVDAVKNLPADECVLDGEVVALDEQGRSSFQLLQAREMEGRKSPVYFYAFDLLQLDGKSLVSVPLEARKNILEKLCAGAGDPQIRYSGAIGGDAEPAPQRSATPRLGRNHRQITQLRLRTRPEKRRMDQTQMCQRTGIRHRRIHPAARGTQIFRRNSRRLLQRIAISYSPVRSAPDLQRNYWPHSTRNSAPRNVPTVRLSICHQSKTANGCSALHLR